MIIIFLTEAYCCPFISSHLIIKRIQLCKLTGIYIIRVITHSIPSCNVVKANRGSLIEGLFIAHLKTFQYSFT